jgi:hypothetical protein
VNKITEENGKENLMLRRKEAKRRENKRRLLFKKFPFLLRRNVTPLNIEFFIMTYMWKG